MVISHSYLSGLRSISVRSISRQQMRANMRVRVRARINARVKFKIAQNRLKFCLHTFYAIISIL